MPAISAWRNWWKRQQPQRQDRYAVLAPLLAVALFLVVIVASFWYLRTEEAEREQEAIKRDVEYGQQRLRLRLLERQEQLMLIARDISNQDLDREDFVLRSEQLVGQYPELQAVTWIDANQRIRVSYAAPIVNPAQLHAVGTELSKKAEAARLFGLVREFQQPVYNQPVAIKGHVAALQMFIPLANQGRFAGALLAEFWVDGLLRYGVPADVSAKYALSLVDARGQTLAGGLPGRPPTATWWPYPAWVNEYEIPVSPVGNGLILKAQAWRTSQGLIGSGLFWLVCVLSVMTAWLLIGTWRHTRRRVQAQKALVAETNFRRAMENSMLTGMRALDMQGRITYVNPAFCQMTGWSEGELVGHTAPFAYWPDDDREQLTQQLQEELSGRTRAGGFQVRVKRKDGGIFDARMYVSPLVDAVGKQTGWMTSMTDITEPNRIREQLQAAHERFTTVLEALDAAVSVAPLSSEEILFANKLYRLWFGQVAQGHIQLLTRAGMQNPPAGNDSHDAVDGLMGLPTDDLVVAQSENSEIYIPSLDKWLEVRSRYLHWVDGRLAQMVIATDITARHLAQEQAAAQAERAQTSSRLITMGEMASSVAHELNQPLTAINNYCNGLLSRIKSQKIQEDELLRALEKTAHQAQRAGQIIQRIRSFVKRSEPNRALSDVADMVNEASELADIELRRRRVRLSRYVAAGLPKLLVDPILIEQVLVNLLKNAAESIDNAQRAAAQRHAELKVVPGMQDGQSVVEFSVTDSGRGLAPQVMERLYEAFFSTKPEGMGIGLSLCRSIVESHQGRIQALNIYNDQQEVVGCRFSFWIPTFDMTMQEVKPQPLGVN